MRNFRFITFLVIVAKVLKPVIGVLVKFLSILVKVIKGSGAIKLGLGITTFSVYSILFDWRFALCLMVLVGVHESGHVWAMRKMGMVTRGFYFIPFFGGMAVPGSAFPSAFAEGYVALMGPIWGLFVTFFTLGLFFLTNNLVFQIAACWMAFVNLINLIPIYPLDGGRVIKSVFQSLKGAGFIITLTLGTVGIIFLCIQNYWLFTVLGILGLLDVWFERKEHANINQEIKPYAEKFLEKTALILDLPKDRAHPDIIEHAIWKFTKRFDEFKRLQNLRQQYQEWVKRWKKVCKRFKRRFGVLLGDQILFLANPDPIAEMQAAFEKWEEKSQHLEGHKVWRYVSKLENNLPIFLPDAEYERLRVLVAEFRSLINQTNKVISKLNEAIAGLCKKINLETQPLQMELRRSYRFEKEGIILNEETAKTFVFLAGYPLTPIADLVSRDFSIDLWGESVPGINWYSAIIDTFILIAADPRARADFFKEISRYVTKPMTMTRNLAIAASYITLIIILFLIMEFTGGHEAAEGACNFFRK